MTLFFIVGTAAELIKIYPLIDEAQRQKKEWRLVSTGQSGKNLFVQIRDFQIPTDKIVELNPSNRDLKSFGMALRWFFKSLLWGSLTLKNKMKLSSSDKFIVHGDTLSTLLGTLYGRYLGLEVVHVEAGMRSHNWRSPFPEEINRRIVSKLAHVHMCPDENAKKNLIEERISGKIIVTGGNTVLDALKLCQSQHNSEKYVLLNFHRFENLGSGPRWDKIIDLSCQLGRKYKTIMVMMPNTEEKLSLDKVSRQKLLDAGVVLKARLPFKEFASLLGGSYFIVTDGGSNQQESFYLGRPCLIMRDVTESIEGIGSCCVLSQFKDDIIQNFLDNVENFRRPESFPEVRPTDIIFRSL